MSQINVDSIANTNEDGPVYFPYGMRGDASNLIYEPKVLYFDPVPLSTGISTTTNITITFDQQIQFSGVGTIYIREGSATGTILENFTCGVDAGATIAGETLVINPTSNLGFGTSYYVTLPSVGIANTFGAYYKGTSSYFFQTTNNVFSAVGGNHEFTIASAPSPTGYYKYHVFTSTGILTTYGPSVNSSDLSAVLVAGGGAGGWEITPPASYGTGGGGAGGLLSYTGPTLALGAGTYTITVGAGGASPDPVGNSGGGNNSTIGTPTSTIITAFGGGAGGMAEASNRGPLSPIPGQSSYPGEPGGSGGGGAGLNGYVGGNSVPGQGNSGGTGSPVSPSGGGGGGAGGSGSPGASAPANNGGPGAPNPAFATPLIAPYVPTIPAPSISQIGPSGLFAGGGGGSSSGLGGPGGGGIAWGLNPSGPGGQPGFQNTGGGGGAGYLNPSKGGTGGSGVFMIRYAVPAP